MVDFAPDKTANTIQLIKQGSMYVTMGPWGRPRGQMAALLLSSGQARAITNAASQADLCPQCN